MDRKHTSFLINWLYSNSRKPLIIRGARQVGKTWLIKAFATEQNRKLIELNFEKRPELSTLFSTNDPKEILINIAAATGIKIDPQQVLLFLDEIQAAPQLLGKLRWFAEEMPELPVIAAGSLLDFTLEKHEFSMPVGRIGYLYLEPFSFEEFLNAFEQNELLNFLRKINWNTTIPEAIHNQLMKYVKEYIIIGGMPAAIASWIKEQDPSTIHQIHYDLLSTYRDDFAKYQGRLNPQSLSDTLLAIPRQLGKKFVYKHVNAEINATSLKNAFNLLSQARICHQIISTHANGLPLGAEANEKFLKAILLDCGLCSTSLGFSLHQIKTLSEITLINKGGIAEQFVGQQLRTIMPPFVSPSLYYWQREKKGSEAEIDYIIQHEDQLVPIEVKAGKTGTLKSLHQFMKEKKRKLAIRINSEPMSYMKMDTYELFSIPFYLIGQIHRLLNRN